MTVRLMDKISVCTQGEARGDVSGSGVDREGLRLLLSYFISLQQLFRTAGREQSVHSRGKEILMQGSAESPLPGERSGRIHVGTRLSTVPCHVLRHQLHCGRGWEGTRSPPCTPTPPGSSFKGAIVPECTAMAEENKSQRYSESERVSPALQKEL